MEKKLVMQMAKRKMQGKRQENARNGNCNEIQLGIILIYN